MGIHTIWLAIVTSAVIIGHLDGSGDKRNPNETVNAGGPCRDPPPPYQSGSQPRRLSSTTGGNSQTSRRMFSRTSSKTNTQLPAYTSSNVTINMYTRFGHNPSSHQECKQKLSVDGPTLSDMITECERQYAGGKHLGYLQITLLPEEQSRKDEVEWFRGCKNTKTSPVRSPTAAELRGNALAFYRERWDSVNPSNYSYQTALMLLMVPDNGDFRKINIHVTLHKQSYTYTDVCHVTVNRTESIKNLQRECLMLLGGEFTVYRVDAEIPGGENGVSIVCPDLVYGTNHDVVRPSDKQFTRAQTDLGELFGNRTAQMECYEKVKIVRKIVQSELARDEDYPEPTILYFVVYPTTTVGNLLEKTTKTINKSIESNLDFVNFPAKVLTPYSIRRKEDVLMSTLQRKHHFVAIVVTEDTKQKKKYQFDGTFRN